MRDMMSILLENTLDAEMDEELGYSKYDYKNKDTDMVIWNANLRKEDHGTIYGDMDIKGSQNLGRVRPQVVKEISEYRDAGHGGKDSLHVC